MIAISDSWPACRRASPSWQTSTASRSRPVKSRPGARPCNRPARSRIVTVGFGAVGAGLGGVAAAGVQVGSGAEGAGVAGLQMDRLVEVEQGRSGVARVE